MAKINPKLFSAIIAKTNLSKPQIYKRIQQVAKTDFLPRPLAAIKVGANVGLAINKYATAEQLAELRRAGSPVTPPTTPIEASVIGGFEKPAVKSKNRTAKGYPN